MIKQNLEASFFSFFSGRIRFKINDLTAEKKKKILLRFFRVLDVHAFRTFAESEDKQKKVVLKSDQEFLVATFFKVNYN